MWSEEGPVSRDITAPADAPRVDAAPVGAFAFQPADPMPEESGKTDSESRSEKRTQVREARSWALRNKHSELGPQTWEVRIWGVGPRNEGCSRRASGRGFSARGKFRKTSLPWQSCGGRGSFSSGCRCRSRRRWVPYQKRGQERWFARRAANSPLVRVESWPTALPLGRNDPRQPAVFTSWSLSAHLLGLFNGPSALCQEIPLSDAK
jgi:hypothetical protein